MGCTCYKKGDPDRVDKLTATTHQKQEKTFRVYAYIICYFFAKIILILMIPFFEPKKIVTFA